ncbi:MAG: carboxypeptidase-like regulatory domain-containing protein [Planctomycetota bacterium]
MIALIVLAGAWWFAPATGGGALGPAPAAPSGAPATGPAELQLGAELAGATAGGGAVAIARDERVRLSGPGRLEGIVYARETNAPVPGVTVRLLALPPASATILTRVTDMLGMGAELRRKVLPVAVTPTDGAGRFVFEGVREGRWYVDVSAAHHVSDTAETVRVVASGSGGPVELWTRAGGRVLGTVALPDGRPASGALVMLTTGAMSFLGAAQTGDVALVETNADEAGYFEFPAVPPLDDYEVSVIGEGFAVTHKMGLVVVAGEDTEVRLVTNLGATITGRVLSRPAGVDADSELALEASEPLVGAQVGVVPRGLRHLKFVKQILQYSNGTTDDVGRYTLRNVPAGEVDVLAMAVDHVPGKGPLVRVGAGGSFVAPDFTLERGPKVRGRVIDTEGAPIAGVRVMWNVVDFRALQGEVTLAPLMAAGMREFEFPLSDAEGRFVAGAFPGRAPYQVRFYCPGFKEESYRWNPAEQGDEIEVTLRRGGEVRGNVVDAGTGAPLTRFTISTPNRVERLSDEPSRWNPFAGGREFEDAGGRFVLDSLEPGKAGLMFSAPGYVDVPLSVEVREGAATEAGQVALSRGATLVGRVVDAAGEPIAGAQVTTDGRIEKTFQRLEGNRLAAERAAGVPDDFRRRGRRGGQTPPLGFLRYFTSLGLARDAVVITKQDGGFELAGLEPGSHDVMVFHRDYVSSSAGPFQLEPGERREGVEVVLGEGGGLFGTVSDRHGRPIEGATVIAASPGMFGAGGSKGGVHQSRTDGAGGYALSHMQGGGYFLVVTRGDDALSPMSFLGTLNFGLVNVPNEGRMRHDIVDTSAGACRVHGVVRSDGEPVGRGSLVAFNFEAEGLLGVDVKVTNVEADGTYEFAGLSPGEYQVQFNGPGPDTKFLIEVDDVPEMRLDIDLPSARIAGRVVDAATREPVRGAELRLEPRDQMGAGGVLGAFLQGEAQVVRKTTGDGGAFVFDRLAAGRYRLVVLGPSRGEQRGLYAAPPPLSLELGEDERLTGLEFELPAALRLEGRLVDQAGAPIPRGVVLARPTKEQRARPETAEVKEDGTFVLGGLGAGTWNLSARSDGYAPASMAALELDPEDAPEPLEFVLERGLEVTVRVTTPGGAPVEGAVATLVALDGVPEASADPGRFFQSFFRGETTTDANGELKVGMYGSGPHQVTVRKGFSETKRTVELPQGGGAHVLTVDLP